MVVRGPTMARTKASARARRDAIGRAITAMNLMRPHVVRARAANRIGRFFRRRRLQSRFRVLVEKSRLAVRFGLRPSIQAAMVNPPSEQEMQSGMIWYNSLHLLPQDWSFSEGGFD